MRQVDVGPRHWHAMLPEVFAVVHWDVEAVARLRLCTWRPVVKLAGQRRPGELLASWPCLSRFQNPMVVAARAGLSGGWGPRGRTGLGAPTPQPTSVALKRTRVD